MFTSMAHRSVIVTGGSRGIGKGIARIFARAGADVLITARDPEVLQAATSELSADPVGAAAGGSVDWLAADVSRVDECRRMAAVAEDRFAGIDVLCANAGISSDRRLADLSESDVDEVFNCNVKGSIFAVAACLPALRRSSHGRVILTSSITGPITGFPGSSHYGASKAAQLGFLRSAALELARDGITINAVLPGTISTEGLADMGEDYAQSVTSAIPLGRLGSVNDIGNACLFLATDEAAYITGQTLLVDGGLTLPEGPMALQAM